MLVGRAAALKPQWPAGAADDTATINEIDIGSQSSYKSALIYLIGLQNCVTNLLPITSQDDSSVAKRSRVLTRTASQFDTRCARYVDW